MENCPAKIRIDREIDGLGERHLTLECCYIGPHPGWKHLNLRIQATIGGDRWTDDPNWSYYREESNHLHIIDLRGMDWSESSLVSEKDV